MKIGQLSRKIRLFLYPQWVLGYQKGGCALIRACALIRTNMVGNILYVAVAQCRPCKGNNLYNGRGDYKNGRGDHKIPPPFFWGDHKNKGTN